MNYFTLDVYHAQKNTSIRPVWERYLRHLQQMRGVLPDDILTFATLPGVDDGLIVHVEHDYPRHILTLVMRCGHLQMGYYDLVVRYEGALLLPEHDQTLAWIARSTKSAWRHACDLAYHEVDRTEDGQIEHRLLFHPGVWFALRCDSLQWQKIARPNREIPRIRDRYPGGPPSRKPDGVH